MILCVCFSITEKEVRELLPCSIEEVMLQTGCSLSCGSCFEALQKLMEEQNAQLDRAK